MSEDIPTPEEEEEEEEILIEQPENIGGVRLDPNSYTAHRLHHATPEHLHVTTRRVFVGPIPMGWLRSHRSEWYKHHIGVFGAGGNPTFTAAEDGCGEPRLGGLERRDTGDWWAEEVEGGGPRALDGLPGTPGPVPIPRPSTMASESRRRKGKGRATATDGPGRRPASQGSRKRSKPAGMNRGESFATANESWDSAEERQEQEDEEEEENAPPMRTIESLHVEMELEGSLEGLVNQAPVPLSAGSDVAASSVSPARSLEASNSLASLLKHDAQARERLSRQASSQGRAPPLERKQSGGKLGILSRARGSRSPKKNAAGSSSPPPPPPAERVVTNKERVTGGLVRFNTAVDVRERDREMQMKLADLSRSRTFRQMGRCHHNFRRREGEIVKMENMLVRVEVSAIPVPGEYDENESMKVVTRLMEKWREFVVVCRQTGEKETPLALLLYKKRVVPAIDRPRISSHGVRKIPLNPKTTKVNLYSTLDKTLVVWLPYKQGSIIYIMRPRCSSSSVEWYTFLHGALGWNRSDKLLISVPDLSLSITVDKPFARVEQKLREDSDDEAPIREERAVAKNLLNRSMQLLGEVKEWGDITDHWRKDERMGLVWRRYDRLEWIHGVNEHRMYGTMAMQKTHELEIRPKTHYPTKVRVGGEEMTEPAPVEGFLLRLTSGKGHQERLGKLFYKRLYFTTHDNLLCFCKPARALPPPPPKLPVNKGAIPKPSEIKDEIPLIYAVAPYAPDADGDIAWITRGTAKEIGSRDRDAYDEGERKVNTLLRAEGFIDLCNVVEVRCAGRHSQGRDTGAGHSELAGSDRPVLDTNRENGAVGEFNDGKTFELVLDNGLTLRLQGYDQRTRDEWVTRLKDLVKYWRVRDKEDLATIRRTRDANLKLLNLDEEMESAVGQFARKWEVSRSIASGEIFNVCGLSSCRAITMSGVLYRKPRRHSTFNRYNVVLCHGELLTFHNTYRKNSGAELPHIHQERHLSLSLRDCFVYSGLVTESELLYQNQTFDSNTPGRHALPRVYQDGMTSHDEDTMTCFVIWHGMRRNIFKTKDDEGKTVRYRVTALGETGKSIVFKARSRLERDAWVMSIGMEIERLNATAPEDIRVTA
ncbi:unnamed protein product [Tuber aestivum]|uniref:PH domain-containing protein n=1 Tax=Tuber aestivum TaxID=59557 RepID=A0A292PQN6_9PEZI|nr:unnamed protein product [Tuber aestivum]